MEVPLLVMGTSFLLTAKTKLKKKNGYKISYKLPTSAAPVVPEPE